ncbi:PspA/IM30 family protein [Roseobacter sp. HKCCA0434]|uniref:PspA/IM30 family protein n=1 Tax=Roseobacter sp. HKCCA0434 TaxID=3079297 RepID=UPI0029058E9D|nr:PspA/IM30 family protein [Roseobacter sp. HKCCA0434]
MLRMIETLWRGANARAEERLTDEYAIELIDQKIREAQAGFRTARTTLATLVQRQRVESRAADDLDARIADLTTRAEAALAANREDLATQAAGAIADMENERAVRARTLDRLDGQITRLRHSLDKANRRIIDLKQGAIGARAVDRERRAQRQLGRGATTPHVAEAEELIARVLGQDDPFEQAEILDEIDRDLDGGTVTDRLGEAGFGAPSTTRASDVLARLKSKQGDEK